MFETFNFITDFNKKYFINRGARQNLNYINLFKINL